MIDHFKKTRLAQLSARTFGWLHREMAPALLRRRIIGAAVVFSALSAVYWAFIASDRYVSEAHVIIQRTDFAGGPLDEARRAKFLASIPMGRFSTALDVANAALYLASDEAAFVSGVCIEVDGGRCV